MESRVRPTPSSRHLLTLAVLVLLIVACEGDGGATPIATSAGGASHASDVVESLCDRLPLIEIGRAAGTPVELEPQASGASVCTYRIATATGDSHHVAIRLEDSFHSIDQVEKAFPDGADVGNGRGRFFWSPVVATLWFSEQGPLYAVQVVGIERDETARDLATAVAVAISGHL